MQKHNTNSIAYNILNKFVCGQMKGAVRQIHNELRVVGSVKGAQTLRLIDTPGALYD